MVQYISLAYKQKGEKKTQASLYCQSDLSYSEQVQQRIKCICSIEVVQAIYLNVHIVKAHHIPAHKLFH